MNSGEEIQNDCIQSKEIVPVPTEDGVLDWISECINENVENPVVPQNKDEGVLKDELEHNKTTGGDNKISSPSNCYEKNLAMKINLSSGDVSEQLSSDLKDGNKLVENEESSQQNRKTVSNDDVLVQLSSDLKDGNNLVENEESCLQNRRTVSNDDVLAQLSRDLKDGNKLVENEESSQQIRRTLSNDEHKDRTCDVSGITSYEPPNASAFTDSNEQKMGKNGVVKRESVSTVQKEAKGDNLKLFSTVSSCPPLHNQTSTSESIVANDNMSKNLTGEELSAVDQKDLITDICVSNNKIKTNNELSDYLSQSDTEEELDDEIDALKTKDVVVFSESDTSFGEDSVQAVRDDSDKMVSSESLSSDKIKQQSSTKLFDLNEVTSDQEVQLVLRDKKSSCLQLPESDECGKDELDVTVSQSDCSKHLVAEQDSLFKNDEENIKEKNQNTSIEQTDMEHVLLESKMPKKVQKRKSGGSKWNNLQNKHKKKKYKTVKKRKFSEKYDSQDTEDYITDGEDNKDSMEYCSYCNYCTTSKPAFLEHIAKHTGDRPFQCKKCDFRSKTRGDLQKHQAKHATVANHRCPFEDCNFATKWPRNLSHHISSHSTERPHVCEICGFGFKRKQDLRYHMFRHSDAKPKACDQCDFCCKTNYELKLHLLKHTDVKNFACTHPGCTQRTKTKSDLRKHMVVHAKTRDAICEFCGKGFKDNTALKKHIERHDDRKLFSCDLCNKHFKSKSAVKLHLRIHEGIRPYKCDVCERTFINKYNKTQHMKVHGDDRPYQCPICPYGAYTADHLLTHIGTMHSDTHAYFCELCRKPYKRYQQLRLHYQRMHTKKELEIFKVDPSDTAIFLTGLTFQNDSTGEKYNLENMQHENKPKKCSNGDIVSPDVKTDIDLADATIVPLANDMIVPSTSVQTDEVTNERDPSPDGTDETSEKRDIKATLAMYGGFRLPLAQKGFKFNFEKSGKKPNSWFMDPRVMDKASAVRYKKYLKRKGIPLPKRCYVRREEQNVAEASFSRVDGEFKVKQSQEENGSELQDKKIASQSLSGIKYDAKNITLKECYVELFDIKYLFNDCLVEEEEETSNNTKELEAISSKSKLKINKKSFKKTAQVKKREKTKIKRKKASGIHVQSKKRKNSRTPTKNQSVPNDNGEQHSDQNTNKDQNEISEHLNKNLNSSGVVKTVKKSSKKKLKNARENIVRKAKTSEKTQNKKGKEAPVGKKNPKCAKKKPLKIRLPTYLHKKSSGKEYSNSKWCSKEQNKLTLDMQETSLNQIHSIKEEDYLWESCTANSDIEYPSTSMCAPNSITDTRQISDLPYGSPNQSEILNCLLRAAGSQVQPPATSDILLSSTDSRDKIASNDDEIDMDGDTTILVNDVTSNKTVWKHTVAKNTKQNIKGKKICNTSKNLKSNKKRKRSRMENDELNISASLPISMSVAKNAKNGKVVSKGDNLQIHVNLVAHDPPRHIIDLESSAVKPVSSTEKGKGKRTKKVKSGAERIETLPVASSAVAAILPTELTTCSLPLTSNLNDQLSICGPNFMTASTSIGNSFCSGQTNADIGGREPAYSVCPPMFPTYSLPPVCPVIPGGPRFMPTPHEIVSRLLPLNPVGDRAMFPMLPVRTDIQSMINAKNSRVVANHMMNPLLQPRYPLGMSVSSMMNVPSDKMMVDGASSSNSKSKSSKTVNKKRTDSSQKEGSVYADTMNKNCTNELPSVDTDEPSVKVEMKSEPPMDIEFLQQAYM